MLTSHSDHSPILLQCELVQSCYYNYSYKFENRWLEEEEIDEVVSVVWNRETDVEVNQRIYGCAEELKRWSRRKFTKSKTELKKCMERMKRYCRCNISSITG